MRRFSVFALFVSLALVMAAGMAGCGDDDPGSTEASGSADSESESAPEGEEGGEPILIKTDVKIDIPKGGPVDGATISEGNVLGGSTIGDSPFCPDGTFRDQHGDDPAVGLVLRTFDCPDGTLDIGFTPGPPTTPRTQAGPWRVTGGTGSFEGLEGDGEMEIKYAPGTQSNEGRETFNGTVTE